MTNVSTAVLRARVAKGAARFRALTPDEQRLVVRAAMGVSRERLASRVNENTMKSRVRKICQKTNAPHLDALVIRVLRASLRLR